MKGKANRRISLALCAVTVMPCRAAMTADSIAAHSPDTAVTRVIAADTLRKAGKGKPNIYALPYSLSTGCPDYKRMWLNTGVLFAGGMTALGVLEFLPENATAWNKEELRRVPFFKRWSNHVRKGPRFDGDKFIFNYVLHPYAGAAYYMSARSLGFNALGSFLYCTAISTLFWEYGIEAFMEVPSIQDLIVTPMSGLILGETFYRLKRSIVDNGYTLCGSRTLGNIVAFLIDPVNEVIGLFAGNPCRELARHKVRVSCAPWMFCSNGTSFGFTLNIISL